MGIDFWTFRWMDTNSARISRESSFVFDATVRSGRFIKKLWSRQVETASVSGEVMLKS